MLHQKSRLNFISKPSKDKVRIAEMFLLSFSLPLSHRAAIRELVLFQFRTITI